MSEVLNDYRKRKVDWGLKLSSESPLSYVNRQLDSQMKSYVVWRFHGHYYTCGATSWSAYPVKMQIILTCQLNLTVVDSWFVLKRDCERIEQLLVKKSSEVNVAYKNTKGRKRKTLDDKHYRLSARRGDIESTEVNKSEIKKCREEVEIYKSKYSNLEKEKKYLNEEMMPEISRLKEEIHDLKEVNTDLADYVEALEKRDSNLQCQGKKINEVGNKQKGRKVDF